MKRCLFLIFLMQLIFSSLSATIIGSDVSVARQTHAFFKRITSSSNKMRGFSVFEKGFVLENPQTTVQFDAFFPIRGDVVLNGGTLELLNDLDFKNPFRIGVGTINGNGYSLGFPRNISYLDFPSIYYIKLIVNLMPSIDVSKNVYSVSWNYDDTYVALGLKGSAGSELHIYAFTGQTLALVAQQDFGSDTINSVRWHPSSDYFALAISGGTELQTWFFNRVTEAVNMVDSANIGHARAVAWRPDGAYLAVGERNENYVHIYPVTNGILGSVVQGDLGSNQEVLNNALSWHANGMYCAVGLKASNQQELRVFSFDGGSFTQVSSAELGKNINSVAWRPNSPFIAIGLGSNSESLRIYQFDSITNQLSEVPSARVGLQDQVLQAAWDSSGIYLAVTKEYAAQGYEVEVYYFDEADNTLHLVSGYSSDAYKRAVGWAKSGDYLVTGDDNSAAYLFNFTNVPFVLKNLQLYFGSEVRGHADIHIQGNCTINGDGNIFELDANSNLIIDSNASLVLEDVTIKGIQGSNIRCLDDSSCITLRDVTWAQDADFTFTQGSLCFMNDVTMKGDARFVYATSETSTIHEKSQLVLETGLTFSYDPPISDPSLIKMSGNSACINLNGAILHGGAQGLALLDGTLRVSRDSALCSEKPTQVHIGNEDSARDCRIDILSGSTLRILSGELHYKNADSLSWVSNNFSTLTISANTDLYLHTMLVLGNGVLNLEESSMMYHFLSGGLYGKVHAVGQFAYDYEK